jgi:hypothetical protein
VHHANVHDAAHATDQGGHCRVSSG